MAAAARPEMVARHEDDAPLRVPARLGVRKGRRRFHAVHAPPGTATGEREDDDGRIDGGIGIRQVHCHLSVKRALDGDAAGDVDVEMQRPDGSHGSDPARASRAPVHAGA